MSILNLTILAQDVSNTLFVSFNNANAFAKIVKRWTINWILHFKFMTFVPYKFDIISEKHMLTRSVKENNEHLQNYSDRLWVTRFGHGAFFVERIYANNIGDF